MKLSIFGGDIADTEAEAVCTSTNPRLSLMMGTGAAVRSRGGFAILRECEQIVADHGPLPAGSVHVTSAGSLPHRIAIHCVASDDDHRSSVDVVRRCTGEALIAAAAAGARSIALPVFGAGHARVPFAAAVAAIAEAVKAAPRSIDRVIVAIPDRQRVDEAKRVFERLLGTSVDVRMAQIDDESESFWSSMRD